MLSFCVSLSVYVSRKSVFCRKGWTDRVGFGTEVTLCYKEIRILPTKNKFTSLWNFVANSWQVDRVVNKTRRRSSLLTACNGRRVVAGRARVYYMSVDRNALTPLVRFVVDLL